MPENQDKGIGFRKDSKRTASKGKNYLLVIGIDDYAHCPRLHNAVKDAKDIVQVLKKRFQFDAPNIHELYDKEATKRNIYKELRALASKITEADNFLLYFSGHGEYDKVFKLGYWIPIEAEQAAVDQYVPNSEIRNILSAIKSHHSFLMIDSCFSGALFAKSGSRNVSLRKERDPSRWGLTAGRNEIVTDGARGTNSPFAKSILYQLENTNKPLGVAELCDKVLEVVSANAEQTPRGEPLKVEGHQGGQFVFHLKKDELADWTETTEAGTLVALQNFLVKYPDGKYTATAKQKIKTLNAAALWTQIETAPDGTIPELDGSLRLVNQYVDAYEDQAHYDEALNYGELLEYKKKFLQSKYSEFALRRFLKMRSPSVPGASVIKESASTLLSGMNKAAEEKEAEAQKAAEAERLATETANKEKEEQAAKRQAALKREQKIADQKKEADRLATETAKKEKEEQAAKRQATLKREQEIADRKKEQERLAAKKKKATKPPKKTPRPPKVKEPSFFEKNAKYIIPLLILPFLIWGISKMIPSENNSTVLSEEMKPFQDEKTKLWGFKKRTIIAIPATFDSVEEFKNGKARVSKNGQQFGIDVKGKCISDCPEIIIGTTLDSYNSFIKKGNAALNKKEPDVETAKGHFQKALDMAKQYKFDDKEVKAGLKKCNNLIQKTEPEAAPLELSFRWGNDQIKANFKGGDAPYELRLERRGKIQYSKKIRKEGAYTIDVTEALRKDAGDYDLIVKDAKGKETTKTIRIDPPPKPRESTASSNTGAGARGELTDSRDGQTYKWVRLKDGKKWMTQNLNYKTTSGSWCYDGKSSNCNKYGRLYTWGAARNACPSGWRLPSDDDWWKMTNYYGSAYSSSKNNTGNNAGKAAYKALMKGGNSGFAALLGGYRSTDGSYLDLGPYGYYWSSTEYGSSNAWRYNFYRPYSNLYRYSNDKGWGFSCRCIQD